MVENAICIHEEDYGILWKHQDMNTGRTEVRRSRRLVVSSISTVGNYEYGFYWYFYLDGTIQLEVKLTGIMSTQAVAPGEETPFGSVVAPGLAAPIHQHLFCARLDLDVDGPVNEAYEVCFESMPAGDGQPLGQRVPTAGDPVGLRAAGPTGRGPGQWSALAVREPVGHQRLGQPGGLQTGSRPDTHPAARTIRASADGPDSHGTTSG